jgi:penicillin-binding protein 2
MFERRLRLFLLIVFVGGFVLALRAAQVQILERETWIAQANSNAEAFTYVAAKRGDLLDVKGRVVATDVPCFEAAVNFRVLDSLPESRWLREEAGRRARRLPGWIDADEDGRLLLLAQEEQLIRNDLEEMWYLLAEVSGQSRQSIDAIRSEIVKDVIERKLVDYQSRQYNAALDEYNAAGPTPWYVRWIAGSRQPPDPEAFKAKTIEDQRAYHTILPDITQEQYNTLALAQDRLPRIGVGRGEAVSVLRLRAAVRRNYPYGDVACQVIGHVGIVSSDDRKADPNKDDDRRAYSLNDRIGREGLESMAEPLLRGTRGLKVNDRRGVALRSQEPEVGKSVRSSIDIHLQMAIQNAFRQVDFVSSENPQENGHAIPDTLSMTGAAVVIDVKTGQVRALVSVPTFDLNRFDELYESMASDHLNRPMMNRALLDDIEPGSIVKPIIGLAAVTQKLIGVNDTIECTGYPIIDGRKMHRPRCWTMSMFNRSHHSVPSGDPHPTGFLTLTDAIERSCNVYFVTKGHELRLDGISYWMKQFGLGRITGIGLYEARGLVPSMAHIPNENRQSAAWLASIGQDRVNATPIQVANLMATIARDGVWLRPRLLVEPLPPSTRPTNDDIPDRVDLKLDPAAVRAVQAGMINVVNKEGGTGKQVRRSDVLVAAKTGSATAAPLPRFHRDAKGNLVIDPQTGRARFDPIPYGSRDRPNPEVPWYRLSGIDEETGKPKGTHSWVAGFAPADNPTIAFAAYVEYGGSGGTGAASVVRKLLDACIAEGYVPAKRQNLPTPPAMLTRPGEGAIDVDQ